MNCNEEDDEVIARNKGTLHVQSCACLQHAIVYFLVLPTAQQQALYTGFWFIQHTM